MTAAAVGSSRRLVRFVVGLHWKRDGLPQIGLSFATSRQELRPDMKLLHSRGADAWEDGLLADDIVRGVTVDARSFRSELST